MEFFLLIISSTEHIRPELYELVGSLFLFVAIYLSRIWCKRH